MIAQGDALSRAIRARICAGIAAAPLPAPQEKARVSPPNAGRRGGQLQEDFKAAS